MAEESYDAVVVGAGHNGLVAGFDLARAGARVLILERRPFVGGACVTEEFAPGYRASSGAYVLSMLRGSIWRDMKLSRRGIVVDPAGPTLNLFADGERYLLSRDQAETTEATRRFSPRDAVQLAALEQRLARLAEVIAPLFEQAPPDPRLSRPQEDLPGLLRAGRLALRHRRDLADLAFLFTTSMRQFLSERFTSEHVMASLGWHAVNDSVAGPSTPGTAYLLLHDHASDAGTEGPREWGFVRGGMGRLTERMADAAREAGATIRTDAEVARVLVRNGAARGVVLADGREIRARSVVSNADPKRTFLRLVEEADLPEDFLRKIRAFRSEGTSIKINLALSALPFIPDLPADEVQPYHRGVLELNPFLAQMDDQQAAARAGIPADPSHIELCFPTVHDPSLAPEGRHIATIDVNSQPYTLREGDWDSIKEGRADAAIRQISRFFPTLPDMVLDRQVLTPLDLERRLALTGGHALHGEMSPDQLLFLRPVRGWANYRTPVRGLYLCGAGTHPGGGVTGANGRNAAREVIRDMRKKRSKRKRSTRGDGATDLP
jgi:phytoene dehydrogenase-like protein